MLGKAVLNALRAEHALGRGEQAQHIETVTRIEAQIVGIENFVLPVNQPRVGVRLQSLVEVPHRVLERPRAVAVRHRVQDVPKADIGLFGPHAASPRHVTDFGIARAIERAAGHLHLFEDEDVGAPKSAIAEQQHRGRQGGNAAADEIGPASAVQGRR